MLCLKAELALISANPATPRPGKFIFQHFSVNLDQETLQEYSRTQIGRRPQLFGTWKTTSIIWEMEDDLNSLKNGRRNQCFWKMEYNLISGTKLEDDLNFLANGR